MRILHLLDHSIPLHSGYAFRTLSILRGQRALGWTTFHLTGPKQGGCTALEEEVDGWHFYRTPPATGPFVNWAGIGEMALMNLFTKRLEEVTRTIKPDLLHAHSPVLNAIPALRVSRQLGIPVVYEVRAFWEDAAVDHGTSREGGLRYRLTRGLETYALRQVDAITTICEGLRQDIVARGIPREKVTVIPNAVDPGKFALGGRPDPVLLKQWGLEGLTVLGFIGSFYAYEGLAILLQALPKLLTQAPKVGVLLVGGGPEEHRLRALVAELGISERVVFTGRVPHDQVQRYYDLIDVLVYPRLSMRLTELVTPLKPLEAMAQGRLLVASDVGGHKELIRDGETGMLFKAGSPDALADKLLQLLAQQECWPLWHSAARRFIETERHWSGSIDRYRRVYSSIITAKAAA